MHCKLQAFTELGTSKANYLVGMSANPASPLDLHLRSGKGRRVLVTGATGYVGSLSS